MNIDLELPDGKRIRLGAADFVASGGQASVYARDGVAYKLYLDRCQVPSSDKLQELAAIGSPRVVVPRAIVRDARSAEPLGCSMRFLAGTVPLCSAFASAWQRQHGLRAADLLAIAQALREVVQSVHAAGVCVVDLNDMNVLLREPRQTPYLIDADSYQTPHHDADAVHPTVQDPAARGRRFEPASDWFAFAVLTFQLFIGLHPFRGVHPRLNSLQARMQAGVSALDDAVRLPPACRPLSTLPGSWRPWYTAVLQEGLREPPPAACEAGIAGLPARCATGPRPAATASTLQLQPLLETDQALLGFWQHGAVQVARTAQRLRVDGRPRRCPAPGAIEMAWTRPGGRPVAAWCEDGRLHLHDLDSDRPLACELLASDCQWHAGHLVIRQPGSLVRLRLHDGGQHILVMSAGTLAGIAEHATTLFSGGLLQNLLGAAWLGLFERDGTLRQLRVPALDGERLVAARHDGGIVMLVLRSASGYRRLTLHAAGSDGRLQVVREEDDVLPRPPEFVTLQGGLCVSLDDDHSLNLFSVTTPQAAGMRVTADLLGTDARLVAHDGGVAVLHGNRADALHHRAA